MQALWRCGVEGLHHHHCHCVSSFPLDVENVLQADPKYMQGMRIQDPDKRLRYIVGMCASKRMDEATGAPQPAYKMDGMKIMLEFPKPKNEEEGPEAGERKQVRMGWRQCAEQPSMSV